MKRIKGILLALCILTFTFAAYASGQSAYPALPANCQTVVGSTSSWPHGGYINNGNPNAPAQLWCYLPMDSSFTYSNLTAYISSNGGAGIGGGSINGTTCTGTVCIAVCQLSWGAISSCGPLATYSGGYSLGTSLSLSSGLNTGGENVLVVELNNGGGQGIYSYATTHN